MGDETPCTRRRALQALGSVVLTAGFAGCNMSGSGEPADPPANGTTTATHTHTHTETETPTPTETETPTETPTEAETVADDHHTHHDHEHTHTQSTPSEDFVVNPEEVHAEMLEQTSVKANEILLGYRLEDSNLPFTTEVYHAPEDVEIHRTETYDTADLSEVPLVPEDPEPLDTMSTANEDVHYGTTSIGEPLKVTLVARHEGEEDIDWTAWNRTGFPYDGHREEDKYLEVACYCGGPEYVAPAGGTWARVIAVTPTERVAGGTTIAMNWTSGEL